MLPLSEVHRDEANCVRRVPIFSGLTPEQQDLVATRARPMHLSRGDVLHVAGERVGSMYVVHTGQIKLSRTMPSGRSRLLRVAQPGETVGEHALLSRDTTVDEAEALSDTQLCVFEHDDFAELAGEYPDIALRMLQTLGDRLASAERGLALGTLSVDVRLADYLLQQPLLPGSSQAPPPRSSPGSLPRPSQESLPGSSQRERGGAGGRSEPAAAAPRVWLPLNKKDIASLLGTTPESLSRALSRLTADGLIRVADDVVTLVDAQALEDRVADG